MQTEKQIVVDRDVTYRGPDRKLDVYSGRDPSASVILVHGGGWFHGDKAKDEDLATRLAQEGFVVFVPNYRLTPSATFPTARDDVLAAVEWALSSRYGTPSSRSRVGLWGSSAGGNLAVEASLVSGLPAVSWSGPLDLLGFIEETDAAAEASGAPTQDFAHISSSAINQGGRNDPFLRWVILELVGKDRSRLREATPLFRATARSGPMYMASSLGEFVPPEGAIKMQRALAGVGVESIVQLLPGAAHAKGFTDSAIDGSLAFLRRVMT
jgi:acetyl esterase/lipase